MRVTPIPVVESSIFSFEFLSMLNPKNQLYNIFNSGVDMGGTWPPAAYQFPDYTTIAKITPIDVENNLTNVDLQSFYEDNQNKAFRGSAPSTISFSLAFKLRDDHALNANSFRSYPSGGGAIGNSLASSISDCNINHIDIIVAIANPIPISVLILTLKPVSSFNSLAIPK